jgi:hypothetical protein
LIGSELKSRTTLSFGTRQAGALQIVSTELHVRAKLLCHLVFQV